MAYLVSRAGGRFEIRESYATPDGPRARQLARFHGALTPDVLERAARQARRPFDRAAIESRARALGVEVRERSGEPEVRALLARLRREDRLDPIWATLLRDALDANAPASQAEVPEALAEVSEWVGASNVERGRALAELLDLYGGIAARRPARRVRESAPFPRFSSEKRALAS